MDQQPTSILDAAILTVRRNYVRAHRQSIEKDTKTHQMRRLALDPATIEVVAEHYARYEALCNQPGSRPRVDAFVFSYHPEFDRPCDPSGVTHRYAAMCPMQPQALARGVRPACWSPRGGSGLNQHDVRGLLSDSTSHDLSSLYSSPMTTRRRALAVGAGSVLDLSGSGTAGALRRRRRGSGMSDDWAALGRDLTGAISRTVSKADSAEQ